MTFVSTTNIGADSSSFSEMGFVPVLIVMSNYLKGRDGDRINAVLAAAGYNFSLLLRWLERLLLVLMRILLATPAPAQNA